MRPRLLAGVALCTLTAFSAIAHAQEPRRENVRASAQAESATLDATQSATPTDSYWTGEWALGDWGGARTKLLAKGVDVDGRLTQGYQGVTTGAQPNHGDYGGKFLTDFSFDFGKLAGWTGFSSQVLTETRWGDIPDIVGNKLIPTTYLITPKSSGTVFAITGLNVTQLLPLKAKGDFIAIGAGRYMGFDGADSPFHGGGGHTTFLHLSFNGTPTHGRLVPSVTNGANLAWIRRGNPFLTFSVRDAVGHPTTPGITDMFEEGVTFISGLNLPTHFLRKSGQHSITGMITTREFTPFDVGPGETLGPVAPPLVLIPESGSWILQYKMYQYFHERKAPDGTTTGWGMFGTFVVADGKTNKSGAVLTLGIGGQVPFERRRRDRFGIAYSQDGVSFPYREQAKPFELNSENVFESFYSFALTKFVAVTVDLQVIRPMLVGSGVALLPGVRTVIAF